MKFNRPSIGNPALGGNVGFDDKSLDLLQGHLNKDDMEALKLFTLFNESMGRKLPDQYYQSGGIPIAAQLYNDATIYLQESHCRRHAALIGRTRVGKTTTTLGLSLDLFHRNNASLILIDKGDLIDNFLDLVDERPDSIILIRVSDIGHPVGISLLQLTKYQREPIIGEIIRLVNLTSSEKLTDRMAMLFRRVLRALLYWPDSTLADVALFLTNAKYRERILSKVNDSELRYFWLEIYARDEKLYRSSTEGIIIRLEPILGDPAVRNILCQRQTNIPLDDLVNSKRNFVLLLDLNTNGKISPFVAEMLARVLLIIIHGLSLSRSLRNPKSIYLICDEIQCYLEPDILAEILSRGVKYGLHLICAFQYISQIGDLWAGIEGNVGSIFSFNVGADDAQKLARAFPGVRAEEFIELPRFHILGRVIDSHGTHCFKGRTFPPPVSRGIFTRQIIQNARQKYARPRAEVEADFRKRMEQAMKSNAGKHSGLDKLIKKLDRFI